ALLRYVFGSIDQNLWGVAAGLTLGLLAAGLSMLGLGALVGRGGLGLGGVRPCGLLAAGLSMLGLGSLFGRGGLALGALLALLLGNPLSGLTSAPEMLPGGWGTVGP